MLSLYQTLSVECRLCTRLGLCTDLKPGRFFFFFFFCTGWVMGCLFLHRDPARVQAVQPISREITFKKRRVSFIEII